MPLAFDAYSIARDTYISAEIIELFSRIICVLFHFIW